MPSEKQSEPDPTPAEPGATRTDSEPTRARGRGRRLIAFAFSAAVLAVVFAGVLPKFGGYGEAWRSVVAMTSTQFTILAIAVVVNIVVYVFPLQAALPGLSFRPAFMVRQTSFTISNAVPAGGAFGLGVQYAMLASAGVSGAASTAAIAIVAAFNLLATLVLPVLGVLALVGTTTLSTAQILGSLMALLVSALAALVAFAAIRSERWALRIGGVLDRAVGSMTRRVGRRISGSMTDRVVSFRSSTLRVLSGRWASLGLTSFAQQLAQFAILVVALRATRSVGSTGVPLLGAFGAFSLARLAGFVPVTPGGLGTVDAALVAILVSLGSTRGDAFTATLLWRAASWAPQIVIGLATMVVWRLRPASLHQS